MTTIDPINSENTTFINLNEADYGIIEENDVNYIKIVNISCAATTENDKYLLDNDIKLNMIIYPVSVRDIFNKFTIDQENYSWRFEEYIHTLSDLKTLNRHKNDDEQYIDKRMNLIILYKYVLATLKNDSEQFDKLLPCNYKNELDNIERYLYAKDLEEIGIIFLNRFMSSINR